MSSMTEPESHTLACLRRVDEKLDRLHGEFGGRLERIEDELVVLKRYHVAARGARDRDDGVGLKAMLDRHERWLGDLGRRVGELEDARKD
jgi:hypothetical protein